MLAHHFTYMYKLSPSVMYYLVVPTFSCLLLSCRNSNMRAPATTSNRGCFLGRGQGAEPQPRQPYPTTSSTHPWGCTRPRTLLILIGDKRKECTYNTNGKIYRTTNPRGYFCGGFIFANFVRQSSRKFPLEYIAIYSNENITKSLN